jgi:hypothetical protein
MTSLALPPDRVLAERLAALGWKDPSKISAHANRTVLVSLTPSGELRVHRGYAFASDRVLRAILRFVTPRVRGEVRAAARRELLAFPVELHALSRERRSRRPRPGDEAILRRLDALHGELNGRYFDGGLGAVAMRLSSRMRRRLGDIAISRLTGRATEITISRRHLRADGWTEVAHTLLHEMVHQWQAEHGHRVDHGHTFRAKAREVGIRPAAERHVSR